MKRKLAQADSSLAVTLPAAQVAALIHPQRMEPLSE
jgi:hypothetical protein